MRKRVTLITGANGEIGHGLISALYKQGNDAIIALDLHPVSEMMSKKVQNFVIGSILDKDLLEHLNSKYEITDIYHLAAMLSTRAEFSPQRAHEVNVSGTLNLLSLAVDQAKSQNQSVKFFFPSSIAVYGMGDLKTKKSVSAIGEDFFCNPETMYGCNKLYCEYLGIYHANYFQRLADDYTAGLIDFRSIRFPGLISAHTVPSGGTSDYLPEMIHAAASGGSYQCFVREGTTMPFMVMPDAIKAILLLMAAERPKITRHIYNITAFNPSAKEFSEKTKQYFPKADITFNINSKRQEIVDSWPEDVDDSNARKDWQWHPEYDLDKAFADYLFRPISKRYKN
jgi:nucleoside-diphosphate-sugar epimerase